MPSHNSKIMAYSATYEYNCSHQAQPIIYIQKLADRLIWYAKMTPAQDKLINLNLFVLAFNYIWVLDSC